MRNARADLFSNMRPSDEIDPVNPFIRKKVERPVSTRHCVRCGKEFILHGEYDKNNPFHDLCDDHILGLPVQDQGFISDRELAE